jgi:DNA-binding transcriptional MerR regulator
MTMWIGEVALRTGLSVYTIRYYEREGLLLVEPRRDAAGRRIFDEDTVEWLQTCDVLRTSGMPVAELKRYADLVRRGPGNERDRLMLISDRLQALQSHVRELQRNIDLMHHKVRYYEDVLDGTVPLCFAPGRRPGADKQ